MYIAGEKECLNMAYSCQQHGGGVFSCTPLFE